MAATKLPGNAWGLKVYPPVRCRNSWELGTRNDDEIISQKEEHSQIDYLVKINFLVHTGKPTKPLFLFQIHQPDSQDHSTIDEYLHQKSY